MVTATVSVPGDAGVTINISEIFSSLGPLPDANSLAKAVLDLFNRIKGSDADFKVYLDPDLAVILGDILLKLGIRTRPVSTMKPPYIFMGVDGEDVIIEVMDEKGNKTEYRAPKVGFIESFRTLAANYIKKRQKPATRRKEFMLLERVVEDDGKAKRKDEEEGNGR